MGRCLQVLKNTVIMNTADRYSKKTYLDGSNDFGMMIGFALECERNDLFSGTQNDVEKLFTINKQKVQTSVRITMCR